MRSLQLDIEAIHVESFGTTSADGAPGTVWALSDDASNKVTCDTCVGPNCGPKPTAASGGDVCCA
jgi:hypothetical protein